MATVNNQDGAPAESTPGRLAHEGENVHAPSILKFAAGIVVLIGVCIIASIGLLHFTAAGSEPADEEAAVADSPIGAPAVPKTRLQIAPEVELQAFAREKAAVLNSYGWLDRSAGRVRIPIAQAIELVAQRGLPVFAATPPTNVPSAAPINPATNPATDPPIGTTMNPPTPPPGKEP